jgi:hypothetical protein
MRTPRLTTAAIALLICVPALGQTLYRYVDSSGAVQYSDKPLIEGTGRSVERISKGGTHLLDKPGAASTAAVAGAQHRESVEEKTEQRRNLALLATYNSLKEIDEAQAYALRDARRELREAQTQMVDTGRRREQLQSQLDGLGSRPVPAELEQKLTDTEFEFKSLAGLVESKRRDVQSINERYDEDRRRYVELVAKGQSSNPIEAAATRK